MTHIASGILIDSNMTEVHATITDLQAFLLAPPDAEVVVYDNDGEQFRCNKNEVTWVCVNEV
jgi:hypothetical protein